jgi:glycosyltransferase involved in cell wall biosynthesis
MSTLPPTTVVIPTLNEEKYLPLLLESLARINAPIEVIVVDGQSDDATIEVARGFEDRFKDGSSLRVISSPRGISRQRNAGAKEAKYSTLLFCDADIVFPSHDAYASLVEEFSQKRYAVAAPSITAIEKHFGARLAYKGFMQFQKFFLLFKRPYFAGSCLLTTKEVFTKIGGFDESIALAEDVDYSFRAATIGSFGLLGTTVPVSGRRFLKYGSFYALKEWSKAGIILVRGGRVTPEKVFYPFGEFSEKL